MNSTKMWIGSTGIVVALVLTIILVNWSEIKGWWLRRSLLRKALPKQAVPAPVAGQPPQALQPAAGHPLPPTLPPTQGQSHGHVFKLIAFVLISGLLFGLFYAIPWLWNIWKGLGVGISLGQGVAILAIIVAIIVLIKLKVFQKIGQAWSQRRQQAGGGGNPTPTPFWVWVWYEKWTWTIIGAIVGGILVYIFRGALAAPFVRFYAGQPWTIAMWIAALIILAGVVALLIFIGSKGWWKTFTILGGLLAAALLVYNMPGAWSDLEANVQALANEGPKLNRFARTWWFHFGEFYPSPWLMIVYLAIIGAIILMLMHWGKGFGSVMPTIFGFAVVALILWMLVNSLTSLNGPMTHVASSTSVDRPPPKTKRMGKIVLEIDVNPHNKRTVTFKNWDHICWDSEPNKPTNAYPPGCDGKPIVDHHGVWNETILPPEQRTGPYEFEAAGDYVSKITFRDKRFPAED